VLSLNFGVANPNPSSFLGNIQWKIVKQSKNSDFYSFFHNATVITNLFEFLPMLPGICTHIEQSVFLLMLV